jgi:hypothetical protein
MDATRKCNLLTLGSSSKKLLQSLLWEVDLDQWRVAIGACSRASDTLSCPAVNAVQSKGDLLPSLI